MALILNPEEMVPRYWYLLVRHEQLTGHMVFVIANNRLQRVNILHEL